MNRRVVSEFMMEYFASDAPANTSWLGVPVLKPPCDLWVYQEILFETRPQLVVECGTAFGGSALFMATVMDVLGEGKVLTIDTSLRNTLPQHPRIQYVQGSSIDGGLIPWQNIYTDRRMVILDSDHNAAHVLQELDMYSRMVTPGCYLIVEDTVINHPYMVPGILNGGPAEALAEWLPKHPEFEVDRSREKFGLTNHPGGYLRRRT